MDKNPPPAKVLTFLCHQNDLTSMERNNSKTKRAIALYSGGLDSILAFKWMQAKGYELIPVYFKTPYLPAERAIESAKANRIELIVKDISTMHFEMLKNPVYGYGKNMNPCIDCHGLMFKAAGELMDELKADYLISGEVLGQRPMSQRKEAMNQVAKLSGYLDLIVRPLSQKLLSDTLPIREGWVDRDDMLDISGRKRERQLLLAAELGISHFPSPAGGCLLTDKGFGLRLKDLLKHKEAENVDLELLRFGRHLRLNDKTKLIIGRNEAENKAIGELSPPYLTLKAKDFTGPTGVLCTDNTELDILQLALDIFLFYHPKAEEKEIIVLTDREGNSTEYMANKAKQDIAQNYLINR